MNVLCLALACLAASPVAGAAPPTKVALKGGRIIPVVGEEIAKGTVLIENGKITAVGAEVQIPYDAMEVDVTGKVLFPGMIDPHSARGLDVPNENVPVSPFLNVYDALDPSKLFFEDSLRDGVTTVHVIPGNNCVVGGVSRVVRPIGLSPDEMTVRPDLALKFSTTPRGGYDRMAQMAALRETFAELDDYLGRLAEGKYEESLKKDDRKIDVGPAEARKRGQPLIQDPDYDDKHLNLVRCRRGELAAWFYCGAATDVGPAIALATEQKLLEKAVFVLGPEAYKAAGELKKAKRPVVLDPLLFYRERDELTGELKETFVPSKIADAGLTFALQPSANTSMAERYLNYEAAVCVRNGLPRKAALEAITLNPATILGLGDKLGSIEAGKTANIVVLSGDPLDFASWVELVYIDGIQAYDRQKDARILELLKLERAAAEKAKEKKAAEEKPGAVVPAAAGEPQKKDGDEAPPPVEPKPAEPEPKPEPKKEKPR
jgi:imidazolonepropionase-like amidohydrolase